LSGELFAHYAIEHTLQITAVESPLSPICLYTMLPVSVDCPSLISPSVYERDKRTNNGLQNITQKTKDRATWRTLQTGCELKYSRRISSSCTTCDTRRVTV